MGSRTLRPSPGMGPDWLDPRTIRAAVGVYLLMVLAIAAVNLSPLMQLFTVDALFGMNHEASVCVWLSSTSLLLIAMLAGGCASEASRRDDTFGQRGWLLFAAAFVLLSLDETAAIHEHAGLFVAKHVGELASLPGVFMWVAAIAPVGLALAVAMGRWFWHLQKSGGGERGLAIAALGVWILVPFVEALDPVFHAPTALIVLEESLEFVGEALMLWAMLLAYRHARTVTREMAHVPASELRAA